MALHTQPMKSAIGMTRARPTTRSIHYKNVSPQGLAFSCLNFVCFDKCFVPDHVQLISLISWNDHNCGGWSSIKLENPDGTHCETNEKSLSAGDTLEWSLTEGGLKGCSNMVVTQNTTLYIEHPQAMTSVPSMCGSHLLRA